MRVRLIYNGPIITALFLLKKRWRGIPEHIFLEHLEEMESIANIEETPVGTFPQAFWLQATRENLENGDLETEYLPWSSQQRRFVGANFYSLKESLDEVIFKLSDVEAYEKNNPWIRHRLVDPDKAWMKRLSLDQESTVVESLEQQLAELEEKLKKANKTKKIRKKRIEELKEQLAKTDEGRSGVNAQRWTNSVSTAFDFLVQIFQKTEAKTWKKDVFEKSFAEQCPDYHTKVSELAWRALPEKFKLPRGRPKKT